MGISHSIGGKEATIMVQSSLYQLALNCRSVVLSLYGSNFCLHFGLIGGNSIIHNYTVAINRVTTDVKIIVYFGFSGLHIFIGFAILNYSACVSAYNSKRSNIIISYNSAMSEGHGMCLCNE